MPWVGLQCVIVAFPVHTHLLFKQFLNITKAHFVSIHVVISMLSNLCLIVFSSLSLKLNFGKQIRN